MAGSAAVAHHHEAAKMCPGKWRSGRALVAALSPGAPCRGGGGAGPSHGAVRGSVAGRLRADRRAVAGQPTRLEVKK